MNDKYEYNGLTENLLLLQEYLENINTDSIKQSIAYLIKEAENDNQEAKSRLSDLALQFSNLNISFCNLAEYIDLKFFLTKR